MGEVYRAKDTKLNREVAIKVLPAGVAQDAERLGRFRREAQVLASLNHPNIAAIYGLDEAGGTLFLVLEIVEGEDLAERLKRGKIQLDEAVEIARQIAVALEEAHDKGIVHRDLKPANIKIAPDGTVKVLDFGLAKAILEDTTGPGPTSTPTVLPTVTSAGTAVGMILGTAAYMSPEQARGRPVDRRADIWSFGVVLFEMLAGKRVFDGETASETIAAVIKDNVPWDSLPGGTPSSVRRLLERCLTRDPKLRLQSIGEGRIALTHAHDPEAASPIASRRPALLVWAPWILLLIFGAFVAWRGLLSNRASAPGSVERRIELAYPKANHAAENSPPSISPDGRWIVVLGTDASGTERLWLRSLDEFDYKPLKGTEGAAFAAASSKRSCREASARAERAGARTERSSMRRAPTPPCGESRRPGALRCRSRSSIRSSSTARTGFRSGSRTASTFCLRFGRTMPRSRRQAGGFTWARSGAVSRSAS
jgi:hypothetical protein